jgi:hypothetical protein
MERADVLLEELAGHDRRRKVESVSPLPQVFTWNVSRWNMGDVWGGPELTLEVKDVLFPTTTKLTRNQTNDIRHLTAHVRSGGDAFLTLNTSDFIKRGKQRQLSRYGIWVFTPSELTPIIALHLERDSTGGA